MTAAYGPSTVAAVLVAGGSGQRLGAAEPKAFVEIAGVSLLARAAQRFAGNARVSSLVVVAPATRVDDARSLVSSFGAVVVAGGTTRQASVLAGLSALDPSISQVLVHDVARPFVTGGVIDAVLDALDDGADAAIPVVAVHDTIRRVDAAGDVVGVVDRAELVAVQTPQGFRRDALVAAHAAGDRLQVTDDAALIEATGGRVVTVPGADELFKITRPWDLAVAGAMLEAGALDG